jgi:hypothetical protein
MAFARLALFPGGTKEEYDAIDQALSDAVRNQPERILHASGQTDRGWQLIQVWKSKDALDRFISEHLGPAMAKVGDRGYKSPPEIIDFEIQDLMI